MYNEFIFITIADKDSIFLIYITHIITKHKGNVILTYTN